MSPFQFFPARTFLSRFCWPVLGIFLAGFFLVGIVSSSLLIDPEGLSVPSTSAVSRAFRVYGLFLRDMDRDPLACSAPLKFGDSQQEQCEEFLSKFHREVVLAMAPFLAAGGYFVYFYLSARRFYKKAQIQFQNNKYIKRGKALEPSEDSLDRYSWHHCLKPAELKLENGERVRAYLSFEASEALPGQVFRVEEVGTQWGKPRYAAAFYAPQMTIVRGVKARI